MIVILLGNNISVSQDYRRSWTIVAAHERLLFREGKATFSRSSKCRIKLKES